MRFLFWGINYAPETTGIAPYTAEWAEWLAARGHEVEVVSTFPYYPEWRKRREDARRWRSVELRSGVKLTRCWHYVPARPSALKRMLHEASFAAASWDRLLLTRADLIIVILPPLLLGAAARIAAALRGHRYQIHVQDLQPDAALGLGMLKPSAFTQALYALEAFGYRGASQVSSIVPSMIDRLEGKPSARGRTALVPNWLRGSGPRPVGAEAVAALRQKLAVPEGALLASYSGNLGAKQGLRVLIGAARRLAQRPPAEDAPPWHFLLIGNGAEREALASEIYAMQLPNIGLAPLLDADDYAALLSASDVCLVTQRRGTGDFFFPSKLLSLWQAGRPVVAAADPDAALDREVLRSGGGWTVPAEDDAALAELLPKLAALPRAEREQRGARGRAWVEQYDRDRVLEAWLRGVQQVG